MRKSVLWGFRPGLIQTGLYTHRRNFVFKKRILLSVKRKQNTDLLLCIPIGR